MSRALVIYHGPGCRDGFAAAWVVKNSLEGIHFLDFKAAQYGELPPDLTGYQKAYILDFSYPRSIMEALLSNPDCEVYCYDHHKTAAEALKGLSSDGRVVFDMARSGAGLTWDLLVGGKRPPLVDYVEDRDLWRFKLEDSKAINAWLASLPFDFAAWGLASHNLGADRETAVAIGKVLLRVEDQYAKGKAAQATMRTFAYHPTYATKLVQVPVINTTHLVSEVLHELCQGQDVMGNSTTPLGKTVGPPFAVGWFQNKEGRFVYSLRSAEGGADVGEIAKAWGGGGHKHAAGFTLDRLLW